jgi:small subunit ribosomal protein S15
MSGSGQPETGDQKLWYSAAKHYLCRHNKGYNRMPQRNSFGDLLKKQKMPLTKEKKSTNFGDFGGKETNTGSIQAQIALLTERISQISNHLQDNKKDFSTHRGLMQLVGKRKRLLNYLQKHDLNGYRQLIEKLGIRK